MTESLVIKTLSEDSQLDMLMATVLGLTPTQDPLIVSLVLCLADPLRVKFAQRTVNTYFTTPMHPKLTWELVIVNSSGKPVTNQNAENVRELLVDPEVYDTLSKLRNYGINNAVGTFVLPVDDDDYSDPSRILLQLHALLIAQNRAPGAAMCSMLTTQTLVDVEGAVVGIRHQPEGIPGTVMFPRCYWRAGGSKTPLYPENAASPGEDEAFLAYNFTGCSPGLIDNSQHPTLHVCFWHGKNLKTRQQFMGEYADIAKYRGTCPPTVLAAKEIFESILLSRGLSLVAREQTDN